MTNDEFCKIDTAFYGDVVDNIKQIRLRSFTGEELKEYVQAAINYTHSCKSDSEQLKDEEIPKIDDWIKDLGYTQITFSFVYKNGGTYKDREQLCKEYKKEFCL